MSRSIGESVGVTSRLTSLACLPSDLEGDCSATECGSQRQHKPRNQGSDPLFTVTKQSSLVHFNFVLTLYKVPTLNRAPIPRQPRFDLWLSLVGSLNILSPFMDLKLST